jgi:mannose-6-phosphate isomerase-like protein (cupin superfamily)
MVAPENKSLSAAEAEKIAAERFAAMGASHCRVDTSLHPSMHTTRTVDYIILLSGQVTLLLDKGEVDLKPFDVVIQRGTNHGWVNRGTEPALLVAVLIDAKPL